MDRFFSRVFFLLLFLSVLSEKTYPQSLAYRKGQITQPEEFNLYTTALQGNFKLYAAGYVEEDFMSFQNAPQLKGNLDFRQGVFEVGFNLFNWNVDASYNAASGKLLNAIVAYNGESIAGLIGQFTPTFGLENNTTTAYLTFMELGLPLIAFSPSYFAGGEINFFTNAFAIFGSVFGPRLGTYVVGKTPIGGTLSAVYSPIHTDRKALHLGVSVWEQKTDGTEQLDLNTQPEIYAANLGSLVGLDVLHTTHFELVDGSFALVLGPLEIEGEYLNNFVHRNTQLPSVQFSGYYVSASYFLTGESRRYNFKSSGFVGITPIQGAYGAWQIAFRYSDVNLSDRDIQGGKERNIAIDLNWYPMRMVKCYLNYIRAFATPNANGVNQTSNFYGLRLQLVF